MFGMPYISRPPIRPARSNTVTTWPGRLSWSAAARPAGPEPTTATRLPVRTSGGSGVIQPSSQARSAISCSMVLIVTGSPLMPDRARALARRGADPAGELGEVVGPVEADRRLAPLAAVDEVVPLRDQVVDRAARGHPADQHAGVAVRDAAVHAARALVARARRRTGGDAASLQSRIRSSGGRGRLRPALDLDEPGRACPSGAAHPGEVARVLLERGHLGLLVGESPAARIRAWASRTRR